MQSLNEAQQQAVTAPDGPALVLAGAGSGKTRVIVERIVWLVDERGVDPRHILALTFTNRAAGEMRQRASARLGEDRFSAWLGTFHSFGLYVLRREMDRLGRSTSFTVYDENDQLTVVKRILKELQPAAANISPREALSWISRLKQDLASPPSTPPQEENEAMLRLIWLKYHAALEKASAVDFDDLIVLLARVLREHEDVRDRYRHRYRYILVDEYQDTNHAQYEIVRNLAGPNGNLFVVGDEDQSIYSWRGADIRNILEFEKDFPGAHTYRLEQNYRSTQAILDVANSVVQHNEHRLGKRLWTGTSGGDPVRLYTAKDGEDEAEFIVTDLQQRKAPPGETAILYRTNGQSRQFEEALRRHGVPYIVIGGIRFYARKEVKDILAYMRLIVNRADDVSLRRILNVPPRGIGETTMGLLEQYNQERGGALFDVLRQVEQDQSFPPRARDAIATFIRLMDDLSLKAATSAVADIATALIEGTGYRQYVRTSDEKDLRSRLEVVDEFVQSCGQFDARGGSGGLMAFLQELSLMTDVDDVDTKVPSVTLLTCHAAKGLEFNHVYLVGLEEGLLPHATALESNVEAEEERRLCYVAMTRARQTLMLTHASERVLYGRGEMRTRSRFLDEIPAKLLQEMNVTPAPSAKESVRFAKPRPPVNAAEEDDGGGGLKAGTRVRHARFGTGTVMYTQGSGINMKAHIRFQTGPTRVFLVSRTPLEILEGKR